MLKKLLASVAWCTLSLPAHAGPMLDELADMLQSSAAFSVENLGSNRESYQNVTLTSETSPGDAVTIENLEIVVKHGKHTYIADGVSLTSTSGGATVASLKFSGDLAAVLSAAEGIGMEVEALSGVSGTLCERLRMPVHFSLKDAKFGDEASSTFSVDAITFSAGIADSFSVTHVYTI